MNLLLISLVYKMKFVNNFVAVSSKEELQEALILVKTVKEGLETLRLKV